MTDMECSCRRFDVDVIILIFLDQYGSSWEGFSDDPSTPRSSTVRRVDVGGSGCLDCGSCMTSPCSHMASMGKKMCTLKFLKRRLPFLEWLPGYDKEKAICDLIAGITVGLTAIPQSIAFALVAGVEPQVIFHSVGSIQHIFITFYDLRFFF